MTPETSIWKEAYYDLIGNRYAVEFSEQDGPAFINDYLNDQDPSKNAQDEFQDRFWNGGTDFEIRADINKSFEIYVGGGGDPYDEYLPEFIEIQNLEIRDYPDESNNETGGDENNAPYILSPADGVIFQYTLMWAENLFIDTVVYYVLATDIDGDQLDYSISGTDAEYFTNDNENS